MKAKIPSRQAQMLLIEISHCVVCGITGWHQKKSAEEILQGWCNEILHNDLQPNGIGPPFSQWSLDRMSRQLWSSGVEATRITHEAQSASLKEFSETSSESETEDGADASSGDGQEELQTPTLDTTASSLANGDDLVSGPASNPINHLDSGEEQESALSTTTNDNIGPQTSCHNNIVNQESQQAEGSLVSVEQRISSMQRSSRRLQVYHDPLPLLSSSFSRRPELARQIVSTTLLPTACTPSSSRCSLATLDRNVGVSSQIDDPRPRSGVLCASERKTGSSLRGTYAAVHDRATDRRARHGKNKTADTSCSGVCIYSDTVVNIEGHITQQTHLGEENGCGETSDSGLPDNADDVWVTETDEGGVASQSSHSDGENILLQTRGQLNVTSEEGPASPKTSLSSLSRGFQLYRQLDPKANMKSILKTILRYSCPRNRSPGYIYAFSHPDLPNLLKIGVTNAITKRRGSSSDPVDYRLACWASNCGRPVKEVFREYMPCAAERMESLIHQTLQEYRRIQVPACKRCKGRKGGRGVEHDEWFEVDVETARETVRSWALFSGQRPYNAFGQVVEYWARKAEQELQLVKDGPAFREWLGKMPQYVEEMMRLEFRSIVLFAGASISSLTRVASVELDSRLQTFAIQIG